ncbi:MAG: universal stress protein [Candidatus Promineifilaceae bacterium]|nr:universal stress protein [Candidatus Promineifilaceae bacterium]
MSGIVCAIRGGPSSQSTIRAAIRLARERDATITFLYVFDLAFLTRTSTVPPEGLADSMAQMGEFILLMAQDRALESGVPAEAVMRKGEVGEEIVALCNRLDADLVVVGAPLQGKDGAKRGNVFTPRGLQALMARIAEQTGAEVVVVAHEEEGQ